MSEAAEAARLRKRLFIRSWGCQMNVYDSGRMAEVLAPLGYGPAAAPDAADMVILNTCHIREKASEKLFSELGRLRALKREREAAGGRMVLAVAGCVAQAEGAEITARAPWVDIVLGPQTYHRLPEMVARASRAAGAVIDTEFPVESKFDHLPEVAAAGAAGRFRLPHRPGGLRQISVPFAWCLIRGGPSTPGPPCPCWPRQGGWWREGRGRSRCSGRT